MQILLRLVQALRPYLGQVAALFFCVLAVTATSLVTPSLIRSAIDDGLAKNSPEVLFVSAVTIVGVGLLRSLFNLGRRYVSEWLSNRVGYDFRNAMYEKIQRLPFSFHDQMQTGQLMSLCTEDVGSLARSFQAINVT